MIKVRELIEQLQEENPEADVILQKDSEGNGYSPLFGVNGDAIYEPNNAWSGEVFDTKWSAEDAGMPEDEWEKIKQRQRCVVLYPAN